MSSLPPLSVTVNSKKWSCVLDTPLALSRYGLLLAQRLGEEFNLWLVRELWEILDNTQYYRSRPKMMTHTGTGELPPKESRGMGYEFYSETLDQWESARIETDIAGLNVYWIGDAIRESYFPQGIDQDLIYRFEILSESLDRKMERNNANDGDVLLKDCCRDAAALTAALMPQKGFILTCRGGGDDVSSEDEPFICTCLEQWGIKCPDKMKNNTRIENHFFNPIFERTGVDQLVWAGLSLAAVYIIAPHAVIMPRRKINDGDFAEEMEDTAEERNLSQKDWWDGAIYFWHPL